MRRQHPRRARAPFALVLALGCGSALGPQPRPGWLAEDRALEARCERGSSSDCAELGRRLVQSGRETRDLERGLVLLEAACGEQDGEACAVLGSTYRDRVGGETARARARAQFSMACHRRVPAGCTGLGTLVGDDDASQGGEARQLFRTACELGDSEGCERLGLAESDELSGDRGRAEDAFTRACRLGRLSSCHRLAMRRLAEGTSPGDAVTLLIETCNRGNSPSCLAAALIFAPAVSPRPDCGRAIPLGDAACRGGQRDGCAIASACRASSPEGRERALQELQRTCEQRNPMACLYWADVQGDGMERERRHQAYRVACRFMRVPEVKSLACGRLAAIELANPSTPDEKATAVRILEKSCQDSSGQACCDLAEAYRTATDPTPDAARASELRKKACDLGEQRCCGPLPSR